MMPYWDAIMIGKIYAIKQFYMVETMIQLGVLQLLGLVLLMALKPYPKGITRLIFNFYNCKHDANRIGR